MTAVAEQALAYSRGVRRRRIVVLAALLVGLVLLAIVSIGVGPISIPAHRVVALLLGQAGEDALVPRDALVILNVRLPRTLLGIAVGAALAVSGAVMQGLFRNPLADPGLIGVSSGAALAAAVVIVVGDRYLATPTALGRVPFAVLPIAAFCGALSFTLILYGIATRAGRTSVATMLLAGVALGALAASGIGLLVYISDDRQLRDLTFWSLGSLSGANWIKTMTLGAAIALALVVMPFLARTLDALVLGEAEAYHLGIPVQRAKISAIVFASVLVAAAVATCGVIAFVGIVVPHLLRLVAGPRHGFLLPASACLGGILLVAADTVARTVAAPAELPIGILTAAIGAPFFLWLLLRGRGVIER
jgi:iron complex transport system permease protein